MNYTWIQTFKESSKYFFLFSAVNLGCQETFYQCQGLNVVHRNSMQEKNKCLSNYKFYLTFFVIFNILDLKIGFTHTYNSQISQLLVT